MTFFLCKADNIDYKVSYGIASIQETIYFIWGIDDSPYGPVRLPVLIDWINDERVVPDTWVFRAQRRQLAAGLGDSRT